MLTRTIVGPDDVLRYTEAISPVIPDISPKRHERPNKCFMLEARFLAAAAGTMRSDVTRIIPTIFRLTVTMIAIRINRRYSKNRTLMPSTFARSLLNVIWRNGFKKNKSVVIEIILTAKSNNKSILVMARISPKEDN